MADNKGAKPPATKGKAKANAKAKAPSRTRKAAATANPKPKPKPKARPSSSSSTSTSRRTKDPFKPVRPEDLCVVRAKSYFGGSFPRVKGARFRYPAPENEAAWLKLVAEALTYRKRKQWCFKNGLEEKKHGKASKYEYILYHARPDQVKRRTTRNRHRRHALKNGTLKPGEELHHQDAKNLRKPIAVTPCQHNRLHGEKCEKTLPSAKRGAKTKPETKK